MTRMHPPFRYMSQFKAIAMDFEYYSSLEDVGRLYCLTDKQVYMLLAQCEYIGWFTRWYNTEDTSAAEVKTIQSAVMEALMSCVDITILVETNKQTVSYRAQQQQIQSRQLRKDYQDEYTGDPTSINPDAPTTDFGASGDRYSALCAAIMAFVYSAANAQCAAVVAGDMSAYALLPAASVLLIPGLNLFAIAAASIALLAGAGITGLTPEQIIAALTNTSALNNVVCYMRGVLKDQSVTEANWAAALDSYPFTPGSAEAIICDSLKPQLADNYLGALDMMGQGYAGVTNGDQLPDCPCDEENWIISVGPGYNNGSIVYQTSNSIRFQAQQSFDTIWRVNAERPIGCSLILTYSSNVSLIYVQKTPCVGSTVSVPISTGDDIKSFAYAANSAFYVEFTW